MYLQKLELHGFKSFADKTVIDFAEGVTAIVGPNGCGKSNVIDAVRWVLGEQRVRILRSDRMENVIFNGSGKRRKPLGLSEVSLTVENTRNVLPTEFTQVRITRRLYRSGQSEYLMNNVPCRLRDIQDLFMDTGMGAGAYSVIELKMVEDILSENADDRRRLFEEAAGITKYKRRRTQALRKLKNTQADLTRLRDLVDEIGKRVRQLERQAKKAERHQDLSTALRILALQVAQAEFTRLVREQGILQQEHQTLSDRLEALTIQQTAEEAKLEAQRTILIEREQALAEHQRTLNAHLDHMRRLETDRRLEQERMESAERGLVRAEREQTESEARQQALVTEADQFETQIAETAPSVETAQAERAVARQARDVAQAHVNKQRAVVQGLRRSEQQRQTEVNVRQNALDRIKNRIELLGEERQRNDQRIQALQTGHADVQVRLEAAEAERATAQAQVEQAEAELHAAETRSQTLQTALQKAQADQRAKERQRDAVVAEVHLLEDLINSYAEAGAAVQYLAAHTEWTASAPRTVMDLFTCAEADRRAVEAALGPYADCFVVPTAADVEAAQHYLRTEQKGRAGFIVLDRLPTPGIFPTPSGAVALIDRVQFGTSALAPLAETLFNGCYLAASWVAAQALATTHADTHPAARYIMSTGEWVDAQGRMYAGDGQEDASPVVRRLAQRARLARLNEQAQELESWLNEQAQALAEMETALKAVPLADLRLALRDAERTLAQAMQAHAQVRFEQQRIGQDEAQLTERQEAIATLVFNDEAEVERLTQVLAETQMAQRTLETERAAAETALDTADAASRDTLTAFGEANVVALQAQNAFDNLKRDLARNRTDQKVLALRAEQRAEEVVALQESLQAAQDRQIELNRKLEETYIEKANLDEGVRKAETAVVDVKSALADLDLVLREVRRLREQTLREEGTRTARLVEIQTRLADLMERTETELECQLPDPEIDVPPDFDVVWARGEINQLRQRIRNLGAVNALALESYEEEKTRLDFLQTQQRDLEQAEATLLDTIEEINTTAAERFRTTFTQVQQHFGTLFETLFGEGAKASVVLGGEGDPLEDPIEIFARPSGKKNSTIAQLSGGEKTLTATALLFAIYLVKPSPFCILDEVDAPLDDANIGRFMKLIRQFADDIQFILVTHNKLTMEAADRMYGVTMQEAGVSSVVGVRFDEVEAEENVTV